MKNLIIILLFLPLVSLAQKPRLVIRSGIQNIAMMVSISPDNKLGLTVDKKQELILWELGSGRQLQNFQNIQAADFGPDNKSIDVVTSNLTFRTIDYSGKVIYESPVKSRPNIEPMSYSYYRKSGYYLENGLIYSREKGYLCRIVPEHYSIVQHYSEQLNLLAIASDNMVQLCMVPSGEIVKTIKTNLVNQFKTIEQIKFTQVSPDGKYLLAGNNFSLEILDIASGDSIYGYALPVNLRDYMKMDRAFIDNASFSPDSKKLLILGAEVIKMVDIVSRRELWSHPQKEIPIQGPYENQRGLIHFSDDGDKALIGYKTKFLYLHSDDGAIISRLIGVSKSLTKYHQLRENLNALFLEQGDNLISWNLASGAVQKTTTVEQPLSMYPVQISSNGTTFYRFWQEISGQSGKTTELESVGDINNYDARNISLSFDDKYLLHIGDYNKKDYLNSMNMDQLIVADLSTKKIKWRKSEYNIATFAHHSNVVAAASTWYSFKKSIYLFNGVTGDSLRAIPVDENLNNTNKLYFSPNDTYLTLDLAGEKSRIQPEDSQLLINVASGVVTRISKQLPNGKYFVFLAFSPDEKYIIAKEWFNPREENFNNGDLFFYDMLQQKWDLNKTIKTNEKNDIISVSVTKDNRFMFTNTEISNVRLWDLDSKALKASLYPFSSSGEWAVVTPEGRFDASSEAQNEIYFVKGINTFPLEILYETYYTPRLLPRILAGEQLAPIDADFDNLHKAPIAKISYEQKARNLFVDDEGSLTYDNISGVAEITVNATSEDDKISEIRLFHNGKIVNLATRGLFVTDDATGTEAKKYTINLLPGHNSFRAIALNSQRTESKPDEITVNFKADTKPVTNLPNKTAGNGIIDAVDRNATLHLVVVGINQYQNKSMVLNYALADATSFKDELEKDAKSIIANIKTYFIADNEATKAGFENALNAVKQYAKLQDIFIFYYAGHGVIGKDKEFYLVPNDVSDLKNVQSELEQKGIPAKLLQEYAVDIAAQKQLFILDACQSAGAFNEMLSSDGDKQKSIAVVSRTTGTHWIAASGAQQFANEFASLGHGVFTYVMLGALKGSAASNKMITVNGLKNYLQNEVPEMMKKYSGTLQYPASYGFGNDFPVEVIK